MKAKRIKRPAKDAYFGFWTTTPIGERLRRASALTDLPVTKIISDSLLAYLPHLEAQLEPRDPAPAPFHIRGGAR